MDIVDRLHELTINLPAFARDLASFSATAAVQPLPPAMESLVGRPSGESPTVYHRNAIGRLLTSADTEAGRCRLHYHASQLAYLLAPQPQSLPLVSIVIPAFNAGRALLSSVTSALYQSYPHCEVVVIDDGSTDSPEEILAPYLDKIRLYRQQNFGVAAARNRGIQLAKGSFIHFLDADDMLDPLAVERKVRAFLHIPDADVCYSLYRCCGSNGVKGSHNHRIPLVGDEYCPTKGLLRTLMRRFPFQISSMLLPRWVLVSTGPFEEDLRQSQDNRYWFRLGLRNAKVIGLREELNTRIFRAGSLTSRKSESAYYATISYLRNLADLLESPEQWAFIGPYFKRCLHRDRWRYLAKMDNLAVQRTCQRILDLVDAMPEKAARAGLSLYPLVAVWNGRLKHATWDYQAQIEDDQATIRFLELLKPKIERAAALSKALSPQDAAFWMGRQSFAWKYKENRSAVSLVLSYVVQNAPQVVATLSNEEYAGILHRGDLFASRLYSGKHRPYFPLHDPTDRPSVPLPHKFRAAPKAA